MVPRTGPERDRVATILVASPNTRHVALQVSRDGVSARGNTKNNVTTCTRFARVLNLCRLTKRQQIRPKQRPNNCAPPHRSPFPHRTSHEQARRITMRVHAGRRLPTPQMISNKLLTALALLAQHGTALDGVSGTTSRRLDDLCAPASTSAARRVYAAACRDRVPAGLRRLLRRRTTRPRRRRPRRPCRAGAQTASKSNDVFKNPIWSKSGAASTAHRLCFGLPVDRTTPRRLAVGPATRGLPAGCPGEATTIWQHMRST